MKLGCFRRLVPSIYLAIALFALPASQPLNAQSAPPNSAPAKSVPDYSGMYAFLRDGEFVQLNLEDDGRLTGFVSRYGDSESDRGVFLDQFFKQAKIDGNKVSFTTAVVHGVWYDFKGTIERGDGKNPGDEAYYVLKGTLTQFAAGGDPGSGKGKDSDKGKDKDKDDKKAAPKSRDVAFKSFPRELAPPQ